MSEKIVVNELLAFLQQKLDVMDEVSAVQICKSNFSEDEVAAAKKLLYESLNKLEQMVSRRRDGTPKSLQDIITLLKETDPDDVPTFVARDLNKLPPVTFDHVDVTSLLKDIVTLKASLADMQRKFAESQDTVGDMRKEIDYLRASLNVIRSPVDVSNVNTRRGGCVNTSVSSFASADLSPAPLTPPPPPRPAADSAACASSAPQPAPRASPAAALAAPPARAPASLAALRGPSAAAERNVTETSRRNFATVVAGKSAVRDKSTPVKEQKIPAPPSVPVTRALEVDDGFIKVQRKRARRKRVSANRCGTAPTGDNFLLRAATPTTAMYLSRLHHSTQVQDVEKYIKVKTDLPLRVQPLESHHNASFNAFVVRVPTSQLDTFMQEDFWPKGVVYRRFRGRVPTYTTEAVHVVPK